MKEFFKKLLGSNDNISSKRLMGLIAFICMLVMAFMRYDISIIITLIGFITALMGLGSLDKRSSNYTYTIDLEQDESKIGFKSESEIVGHKK